MMDPDEIERLSWRAQAVGMFEIELSDGASSLRLRLVARGRHLAMTTAAPVPAPTSPHVSPVAKSPGVGFFRHRHPVSGRPACESGERVVEGQVIGYVESGPCLRPVTAPCEGVVGPPAREDGDVVGYGTHLYRIG